MATLMFRIALVCGLLHAAPSLYWAAGGDALVDTVGVWAVQWRDAHPVTAALALAGIGIAKACAAIIPYLDHRGVMPMTRVRGHRPWRTVSWVGGAVIVLWGGLNTVGAWLQLAGAFPVTDRAATLGHALLWDPLFAVWGLALLAGLALTRPRRDAPSRPVRTSRAAS